MVPFIPLFSASITFLETGWLISSFFDNVAKKWLKRRLNGNLYFLKLMSESLWELFVILQIIM